MTEITGMDVVNARLMAGLTRSKMASKLGIATSKLRYIEDGHGLIDAAAVDAIVDEELFKLEDPGPGPVEIEEDDNEQGDDDVDAD